MEDKAQHFNCLWQFPASLSPPPPPHPPYPFVLNFRGADGRAGGFHRRVCPQTPRLIHWHHRTLAAKQSTSLSITSTSAAHRNANQSRGQSTRKHLQLYSSIHSSSIHLFRTHTNTHEYTQRFIDVIFKWIGSSCYQWSGRWFHCCDWLLTCHLQLRRRDRDRNSPAPVNKSNGIESLGTIILAVSGSLMASLAHRVSRRITNAIHTIDAINNGGGRGANRTLALIYPPG